MGFENFNPVVPEPDHVSTEEELAIKRKEAFKAIMDSKSDASVGPLGEEYNSENEDGSLDPSISIGSDGVIQRNSEEKAES